MSDVTKGQPTSREVVTFHVGDQEFCVDIRNVREIRGWSPVTTLPHSPEFIMGVLNLRGIVVPIIDVSARLGLGPTTPCPRHVIIIAEMAGRTAGFLVSAVSKMLELDETAIQPLPEASRPAQEGGFTQGLIATPDGMLRLLDLSTLFPHAQERLAS